ncbi:MAG: hypothetical protein HUJ31_08145 [Pseudomonadales bacterium]|nr:hypothetical protein [Pseudomonadales bacterium]
METRLLLVDGFNLIRRIYEARQSSNDLEEIITACGQSLQRALREHSPSHAVVVLDSHDRTWRHLLYPEYKANRKPTPAPLLENLDRFEKEFAAAGVKSLKIASYEADDVIATMARGMGAAGTAIILSTDRLFLQLLGKNVRIFNHFDHAEITAADVAERYGVGVDKLTDFHALAGDASNNIKGAPGIGPKTAKKLLDQHGDLEGALSGEAKLASQVENLRRCKQLVTLKTDVELGVNLREFRLR